METEAVNFWISTTLSTENRVTLDLSTDFSGDTLGQNTKTCITITRVRASIRSLRSST
jgi:hypothetical protein